MRFFVAILFTVASVFSYAQDNTSYELKNHIIYYNVFNSTLLPAEVAAAANLTRAKNQVYVNVALVKKSGGNGIPAKIYAVQRNLMQQKVELDFIEIKETNATYYLAPIRINNEDILHIDVTVSTIDGTEKGEFTITKKLYID